MKSVEILLSKVNKKDSSSRERLEKSKVRAAIESICQENLQDFNDMMVFEALPNAIDNTLAVIEEPLLASKYEFEQINESLFRVRLKELSII